MKNKEEDMELISNDNKKSFESLEIEDEYDERCCIFNYKILFYKK